MRTKKILSLALASLMAVAVTFTACKEDAPEEPLLTIAPTAPISVNAEEKTVELTVTSNVKWTATVTPADAAAWCTLDKSSGATNATVKVTIKANTTTSERTATITFSGSDVKSTAVTVKQSAATAELSAEGVNVTDIAAEGSTDATINVTGNVDWTATTDDEWIHIASGSPGSGTGTVTLTIDENATESLRSGTVTITGTGVEPVLIEVTQVAADPAPAPSLSLGKENISGVPAAGDNSQTITVTSNVDWSVASNEDWVIFTSGETGSGNGTIELNIGANTALGSRSATVTVSARGVEDQKVNITQLGVAPVLTAAPTSLTDIAAAGTTTDIAVTSNVEWTASVTIGSEWIHITSGSPGNGTGIVALTIDENATEILRSGTVTITGADVEPVLIEVTQLAASTEPEPEAALHAEGANVTDIAAAGSTEATINVTGNVEWTASVTTGDEWIHITSGSPGNGTGIVTLTIDQNTNETSRAGTVTITGADVKPVLIEVTQVAAATPPPASVLTAAPASLSDIAADGTTTDIVVTSNVAWTASVTGDNTNTWIELGSPQFAEGNSGNGTFTVTIKPNGVGAAARNSTITLSSDADVNDVPIAVAQLKGADATLSLNPTTISDVSADGDNAKTIAVTSNTNWTAESNEKWVVISSGNTGNGDGTIKLSIDKNEVTESRSATVTVTASGVEPQLVGITQKAAIPAGPAIKITSATAIDAVPAVATDENTKTTYTIAFDAAQAWSAEVTGGDAGWLSIDPASGSAGNGQSVVVTVNYFKGVSSNISKVRFNGSSDYDVTVTDNYASAVVEHSGKYWAPTDVLDPGQFVPVIKLNGKAYQWNRNIGYTVPIGYTSKLIPLPDGMSSWPNQYQFTYKEMDYPAYASGQTWTDTPCPAGWSMPDLTAITTLLPNGNNGVINDDGVKYWTNTNCPGLIFPAAGEIKNEGTFDKPGSGNPRYGMWGTGESSKEKGHRRRMDSNSQTDYDKHAGNYVRCYK
jgi:hypothetical protein